MVIKKREINPIVLNSSQGRGFLPSRFRRLPTSSLLFFPSVLSSSRNGLAPAFPPQSLKRCATTHSAPAGAGLSGSEQVT